jgi:GMP reductase
MVKPASVPRAFDFDDVILVPGQCLVSSRAEVFTDIQFGNRSFKLPIVPSNMSSVIDERLAIYLASNDYFYVMHRFDVDAIRFARRMADLDLFSSISVGVQESDFALVKRFRELDFVIDYVTVDIAHGDAYSVCRMVDHLKTVSPGSFVIAGNVATPAALNRLETAGADAVKVGIGPGLACSTSPNTGFGTRGWQLAAVEWCADAAKSALVIADGGIRTTGDVAKAVAFGADMVMVGGMFAGHEESPGTLEEVDGKLYKLFYGSASAVQKGNNKNVEGRSMLVDFRGPIADTLQTMKENLQSAVSYVGGTRLLDLRESEFVYLPPLK